jgi:hypothetical protein
VGGARQDPIDQEVKPGATATVKVQAPQSGVLPFHCRFHGNMGMQGASYTPGAATSGSATSSTTSRGY